MGRSRKHQNRLPSVIDSDMDDRFSPNPHGNDSSDSLSDSSTSSESAIAVSSERTTGKRSKAGKNTKKRIEHIQDPTAPSKVDYILTVFSAADMKKPATRREPKKSSIQLSADEPWDTFKAQLLVKIDDLLKPSTLSIDDYEILFSIPRVVTKPGYPLASAMDYTILLERSVKSRLVQLSISAVIDNNKENDEVDNAEKLKKKKGGRRDPATLPGNVAKVANIQALQEPWKCAKKTTTCLGTYCFVNNEGVHLPLSHERLDCWAAAMVSFLFLIAPFTDLLCSFLMLRSNCPRIIISLTTISQSCPLSCNADVMRKTRQLPPLPPSTLPLEERLLTCSVVT